MREIAILRITLTLPRNISDPHPSRRNLVFVWNYLSWGGAQVYFLAIMKLAKERWDITVILPADSSPEMLKYLEDVGVVSELVDYKIDFPDPRNVIDKVRRQLNRLRVEYRTYRELLKFDVRESVFHIEIAPWQSVTFLTAMSLRKARLFLTLHNALPRAPKWRIMLWKSRLQFVSKLRGINFFASNADTKNRLRGWVDDKFWDRIRVTYTAVNPPQIEQAASAPFDKKAVLTAHGLSVDDFIVLCVGQFIDRKGRWTFLESASRLLEHNRDITFLWVAPRSPSDDEQQKIESYGLGEKFRIILSATLGGDRLDVLKFFRTADVFALPSYVEGLPIALLEAMALERPSISSNVYAIPEALHHLETGILIEAGDSAALADAILKLKRDASLRERLAQNGRRYVLEHFDERESARLAIEAYEEALDGG